MSVLNRAEIRALIAAAPSLAAGIPAGDPRIKSATLDLTIGNIYQPEQKQNDLGGIGFPRGYLALDQGQTALIETAESLTLPADIVAIGFPPASVSMSGLLMTNPGLVDPGYTGPLRCTVINMGRTSYILKRDARIMRLVLLRLPAGSGPAAPIDAAAIDGDLLDRLCKDFMSVEDKAVAAAKREIAAAQIRGPALMAVVALVVSVVTTVVTNYFSLTQSQADVITKLTAKVNELQTDKIKQLQDYIDHLKASGGTAPPTPPAPKP